MNTEELQKEVKKVLRKFWVGKQPNGSTHACTLPTNADVKKSHPAHWRMTIEEATDEIVRLLTKFGD